MDDRQTNRTTEPIALEYESPHLRLKNQLKISLGRKDTNTIYLTVAGGLFLILGMYSSEFLFVYGIMMLIGGLVCGVATLGASNLTKRVRYRIGILIVMVRMMLFNFGVDVWKCPHATYLRFGLIQFTLSGRACNNPQPVRPWFSHSFE